IFFLGGGFFIISFRSFHFSLTILSPFYSLYFPLFSSPPFHFLSFPFIPFTSLLFLFPPFHSFFAPFRSFCSLHLLFLSLFLISYNLPSLHFCPSSLLIIFSSLDFLSFFFLF